MILAHDAAGIAEGLLEVTTFMVGDEVWSVRRALSIDTVGQNERDAAWHDC